MADKDKVQAALDKLSDLGLKTGTKANRDKERQARFTTNGGSIANNHDAWTPEYQEARKLCVTLADRRKKLGLPAGIRVLVRDKFVFKKNGEELYAALDENVRQSLLDVEAYIESLLAGEQTGSSASSATQTPEANTSEASQPAEVADAPKAKKAKKDKEPEPEANVDDDNIVVDDDISVEEESNFVPEPTPGEVDIDDL